MTLEPVTGIERQIGDNGGIRASVRVTMRNSPNLVIINVWDGKETNEVALSRAEIRRLFEIVEANELPENAEAEAEMQKVLDTLAAPIDFASEKI